MNIENSSAVPVEETKKDPDGFYSVTSRLVLPEGMDTDNLTCAVSHSYWAVERTVTPQPIAGRPPAHEALPAITPNYSYFTQILVLKE